MLNKHYLAAVCGCLLSLTAAADSYPVNYLSAKLGASVSTELKLSGKGKPNELLSDGPVSKGRISFAGMQQRRMFAVDLGSVRTFNRLEISVGGATRNLRIEGSRQNPNGLFTNLFERDALGAFQVLRLPKTEARWVRFDFGEGSGGLSAGALRLYLAACRT